METDFHGLGFIFLSLEGLKRDIQLILVRNLLILIRNVSGERNE